MPPLNIRNAEPDAYRSQQPRLPHTHNSPSCCTTMCPISPANPFAPRCNWPPITMPPPIPVPSVTMTAFIAPLAAPAFHSPYAAMVASFSTCTLMPSRERSSGPTAMLCAPFMLGDARTIPSGVISPGTPTPKLWVPDSS